MKHVVKVFRRNIGVGEAHTIRKPSHKRGITLPSPAGNTTQTGHTASRSPPTMFFLVSSPHENPVHRYIISLTESDSSQNPFEARLLLYKTDTVYNYILIDVLLMYLSKGHA
jgi:hypothetical protein